MYNKKAPQPTPIPPGFQPMPEMATVPIGGRIACGPPILAEQNIEGSACVPARWRATFSLVCKGDSMEPKIHDGDLVAIRKQPEVENGEVAALHSGRGASRTIRQDISYTYPGILSITNQRIIMTGDQGFECPLSKLTSLLPYNRYEGITLQLGRSTYTLLMDEPFVVPKILELIQTQQKA